MWWSGWLAGVAAFALVTLALAAENATCQCFGWVGPFIPIYILLCCFCSFAVAPCCFYRRGCTPDSSGYIEEVARERGSSDELKREIAENRSALQASLGKVVFSSVMTLLLTGVFVALPIALDDARESGSVEGGSWWVPAALLSVIFFLAVATYVVASIVQRWSDDPLQPRFSALFACCNPVAVDARDREEQQRQRKSARNRAPACFGDYPVVNVATHCYNWSLPLIGIALGIVPLVAASALESGDASATPIVLALLWFAFGLWAVVSLALTALTVRRAPCYDVSIVAFSVVLLILAFIVTVMVPHAETVPPHVLVTPLYIGLVLSIVFFGGLEVGHCQPSVAYLPVDAHEDHFEHTPDGSVPRDGDVAEALPRDALPVYGAQQAVDAANELAVDWKALDATTGSPPLAK